ncbi:MAG: macro domain-containing protein, partial [Treponema sp.]
MIEYVVGDIINDSSQCLVNTVNLEGYMGKGIAYQFKLKYPLNEQAYIKACKDKSIGIGKVLVFKENNQFIANFPTKDKWRKPSQYEYIEKGLADLLLQISNYAIESIAIPSLGCGNGGLEWQKIKPMLEECLNPISNQVLIKIYEPSKYYKTTPVKLPKLNISHLLIMKTKSKLNIFDKLRIQKTAFFFNFFSGIEYFKFNSYKFRPYSHSIDILMKQIKEFQDYYNVQTKEAWDIAYKNIVSKHVEAKLKDSEIYLLRALNFVNSVKDNLQLEIIATIIDIIQQNKSCTKEKILEEFYVYPKENPTRISDNMICVILDNLQFSNILKYNLFNSYEVNTDYIKTSKNIV